MFNAIGQSVELVGVLWLGIAAWHAVGVQRRRVEKAKELADEHTKRSKVNRAVADAWWKAEMLKLGATHIPTFYDSMTQPFLTGFYIAREQARQWAGGVGLVAFGILLSVIGSWLEV